MCRTWFPGSGQRGGGRQAWPSCIVNAHVCRPEALSARQAGGAWRPGVIPEAGFYLYVDQGRPAGGQDEW